MKVGIVGARIYSNGYNVKMCIEELKDRFGDDLIIVSGEQPEGVDGFAKKYALDYEIRYVSFPPAHYKWNPYCVKPEHFYNKPYNPGNFFARNQEIVDYSDVIICFIPEGEDIMTSKVTKGTRDTYKKAQKAGKKVLVFH